MTIIYHYTSQAAALSIVNSESIRFTNLHFLNDSSEYKWFFDRATAIHNDSPIKWMESENIKRAKLAKYLKNLGYADADGGCSEMRSIFISCLTSAVDSAPQWDRYSQSGQGVCLGFDKEAIVAWINKSVDFSDPPNTFCEEVNYDESITDRLIRESEETPALAAALHKNPSYRTEEEFRIGYFGVAYWHYKFLPQDGNLKCFIDSKVPNFWGVLKEIWLGSNSRPEAYFAWDVLLSQVFNGNYLDHISLKRSKSGLR